MPLPFLRRRRPKPASRRRPADVAARVAGIRQAGAGLEPLSDADLADRFAALRDSADAAGKDASPDDAFALATEAVRRATGKTFYDVQLQAGVVLAGGDLAEMATGEGKTLVTALPVVAAAARGQAVHVSTTNAYLAARDFEEVAPALERLGLSAAALPEENDTAAKSRAYRCDVVYGTGYEFGFDHLRDQLALRDRPDDRLGDRWLSSLSEAPATGPQLTQPVRETTIVDEVDSVLIDEANTPLVIGVNTSDGPPEDRLYLAAASAAEKLHDPEHYELDRGSLSLTPAGRRAADAAAPAGGGLLRPWRIYVEQALRARHVLRRDIDYVVRGGEVALVDQNTGRIFPERKWRDGLHQAIELKERATLSPENHTVARVSRQRFFQCYPDRTGLTGTAADAAAEFAAVFGLSVVPIPLNKPSRRQTLAPRVFADADAKDRAIALDVRARHAKGQPVLLGTRTIEDSRRLADALAAAGVPHEVLNGVQDADEAVVISQAGGRGAVTVATNMAGRGTDIRVAAECEALGGLHVVGAELHRSRRVDRQLAGRSGRQGQTGSCQFFAAADDPLITDCGGSLARSILARAAASGEASGVTAEDLRRPQLRAEAEDFAARQELIRREHWHGEILQTLVGTGDAT